MLGTTDDECWGPLTTNAGDQAVLHRHSRSGCSVDLPGLSPYDHVLHGCLQQPALVSVMHISSSRPIYSSTDTQTQSKWSLGYLCPSELCYLCEQERCAALHHPSKPGQQHRLTNSVMCLSEERTFRGMS